MGPIGMPEMVVIAVIALIIFGPRKLPELGKSLGKSIAEFKRASNELKNTLEDEIPHRRAAGRAEIGTGSAVSLGACPDTRAGRSRRARRRDDAARRCRRIDNRHAGSPFPRSAELEGLFSTRRVRQLVRRRIRRREDVVSGASRRAPEAHHPRADFACDRHRHRPVLHQRHHRLRDAAAVRNAAGRAGSSSTRKRPKRSCCICG